VTRTKIQTRRIRDLAERGWELVRADERPSAQFFGEAPFRFEGPTFRNTTTSAVGMSLERAVTGTAWGSFLESGLTFQGKPTTLDGEFNRGRPRDPRTGRFVS
jgi:hypothetical protein